MIKAWLVLVFATTILVGIVLYPEHGPNYYVELKQYRNGVVGTLVFFLIMQQPFLLFLSWREKHGRR